MDEITVRILDTLSRELGHPISISELTKKMEQSYGTAYYANTYRKLSSLLAHGAVNIQRSGNSSLVTPNFANYLVTDFLTEMELVRKQDLLEKRRGLLMLLADIDRYFKDASSVRSMSLIDPERNIRLNRIELLVILQNLSEGKDVRDFILKMHSKIKTLQRKHNIRIDALLLPKDEFLALLESADISPLKEMLSNKLTFFHPQTFWADMRDPIERGIHVGAGRREKNPGRISQDELVYNLARFGYKEIGTKIRQGENLCIEHIVTSILMKNDTRRINAIPIILAKNKANYSLLVLLSQKYGVSDRLLGLLRALNKIKPMKEVQLAVEILETLEVKEAKADEQRIREKMALYDAA